MDAATSNKYRLTPRVECGELLRGSGFQWISIESAYEKVLESDFTPGKECVTIQHSKGQGFLYGPGNKSGVGGEECWTLFEPSNETKEKTKNWAMPALQELSIKEGGHQGGGRGAATPEIYSANEAIEKRIKEIDDLRFQTHEKKRLLEAKIEEKIQEIIETFGQAFVAKKLQGSELFQNPDRDMPAFKAAFVNHDFPAVGRVAKLKVELAELSSIIADLETKRTELVEDREYNNLLPAELYRKIFVITEREKEMVRELEAVRAIITEREKETVRELEAVKATMRTMGASIDSLTVQIAQRDARAIDMTRSIAALTASVAALQLPYLEINCPFANNQANNFDPNGATQYIGTRGRTQAYTNPHPQGWVVLANSKAPSSGALDKFLEPVYAGNSFYLNGNNAFLTLDLSVARRLAPTHYCLRDMQSGTYLRNWRLEGSNDNVAWAALKTHNNDDTIKSTTTAYNWPIVGQENNFYRYFKIIITGVDSAGGYNLSCAIELYGMLRVNRWQPNSYLY